MEELYGPITNKAIEEEKKSLAPRKAAIGFNYAEDSSLEADPIAAPPLSPTPGSATGESNTNDPSTVIIEGSKDDESGEDSDSDIDLGKNFYVYSNFLAFL